jgi:CRISPR/Cas system CSM-associated protein Csm2 small subunit
MQNTLIYNELWRDICDGDIAQTKPTNATYLTKWHLKDEKALALLCSSVTEHMFVHIKNSKYAKSTWNLFKKLFDTLVASHRVYLQMKFLKQILADNGDVLGYISRIKNIHHEIIKGGFPKLEDNFLVSIVINGLAQYYKNFLETLKITDKLSTMTFDSLMNYWLNIVNLLENKNNQEKIFFSLKLKVLKEEENQILESFGIGLLIEVMVKVEVVAILMNKIFKVILPIIMHSQKEKKIAIK